MNQVENVGISYSEEFSLYKLQEEYIGRKRPFPKIEHVQV